MGPKLNVGDWNHTSCIVDGVKVEGRFLLQSFSNYIEVEMTSPYQGSWMVRPCFTHRSPNYLIVACKHWAAALKLELEYRKMKAFDQHFNHGPTPGAFGYPEM